MEERETIRSIRFFFSFYRHFMNMPTNEKYVIIYFRIDDTIWANLFSHAYILMTCIPSKISFIIFTRKSVRLAVLERSVADRLPIHAIISRRSVNI